jgi:PBP1b-binding outer membrane lipoprotein LpoB
MNKPLLKGGGVFKINLMIKITSFILSISLFLTSCSNAPKKTAPSPKSYSSDVESEFNSIEYSQKDILNYYRKLREQLVPAPIPQATPLAPEAIKELNIEMTQHMSFYCIKNRKSSRFENKADCTAFTEDAMNTCNKNYPIISNRSIVRCLKSKLR